jgi:hypothetical protein
MQMNRIHCLVIEKEKIVNIMMKMYALNFYVQLCMMCYANMELARRLRRLRANYKVHIITPAEWFCCRRRKF